MHVLIRFAKVVSFSSAVSLGLAMSIAIVASVWFKANLLPILGALVFIYWLPFVILAGAPLYLLLSWTRLPWKLSACAATIATALLANLFTPAITQCQTSYSVRREIISKLTADETQTLKSYPRTESDRFDEERRGFPLFNFPLSQYCPQFFDYKQQGRIKNVSINDGSVFYGEGPVR